MSRFTIFYRARTITTSWLLPTLINRARRRVPVKPPEITMDMRVLITESYVDGAVLRFAAEPLFPGPDEPVEGQVRLFPHSTKVTGRIGHHPDTGAPTVIYQVVQTKPSWQRRGVATELLLRLQVRLGIYGSPALVADDSPEGKALARSMASSGWTTIR